MKRCTLIALGLALGSQFAACAARAAPDEVLEISGGTTPWAQAIAPRLLELKARGIELRFRGIGTGRGTLAVIEGKVSVAAVGDTLEDSVAAAVIRMNCALGTRSTSGGSRRLITTGCFASAPR